MLLDHKHLKTYKHFLETFLKHLSLRTPMHAELCRCARWTHPSAGGWQQVRGGELVSQPRCLHTHRNGSAEGSHKSRCRQRRVPIAVPANKSSREQQGKAGARGWGHDDEILVVIALQVSSQEIKCWHRGSPRLFCLNLTAKSFATSIL